MTRNSENFDAIINNSREIFDFDLNSWNSMNFMRNNTLAQGMPSAVGYQPTLSTEMGSFQERIVATDAGSITSIQAIYVPADDLTDPAPVI